MERKRKRKRERRRRRRRRRMGRRAAGVLPHPSSVCPAGRSSRVPHDGGGGKVSALSTHSPALLLEDNQMRQGV